MTETISFTLDGLEVEAGPGETIWQVAERLGIAIPHLCYAPEPGYRPDGNCRACMVEIEGERVLAASCLRKPTAGMKVRALSERAEKARRMVIELLLADQPPREVAHDKESRLWNWADRVGVQESRLAEEVRWAPDASHPAMRVNLDACIQCTLCVRACREGPGQRRDRMAHRGHEARSSSIWTTPMGASTCVACGECVQACPPGPLMPARFSWTGRIGDRSTDRKVESVLPL